MKKLSEYCLEADRSMSVLNEKFNLGYTPFKICPKHQTTIMATSESYPTIYIEYMKEQITEELIVNRLKNILSIESARYDELFDKLEENFYKGKVNNDG